uniref:SCAN box domain-containing protein n=1 Tax=Knipowitschia caucasica TaxID=637954 RepID=A0AAV2LU14_KNICA
MYRRQFRSTTVPPGENPAETYHRLKGLYRRWIRPEEHTKEEVGDAIILEQFLRVLPGDIRTWVMEHEPKEGLAAAKLTQQYINARKGARQPTPPPRFPRREGPTVTAAAGP